jgi:hypothetical protein
MMEYTKPLVLEGIEKPTNSTEISESARFNQRRVLEEVPGAVFAGMTLAWIIGSFLHLL